jgi:hypothetical protein
VVCVRRAGRCAGRCGDGVRATVFFANVVSHATTIPGRRDSVEDGGACSVLRGLEQGPQPFSVALPQPAKVAAFSIQSQFN